MPDKTPEIKSSIDKDKAKTDASAAVDQLLKPKPKYQLRLIEDALDKRTILPTESVHIYDTFIEPNERRLKFIEKKLAIWEELKPEIQNKVRKVAKEVEKELKELLIRFQRMQELRSPAKMQEFNALKKVINEDLLILRQLNTEINNADIREMNSRKPLI